MHSSFTLLSFTIGGLTNFAGSFVKPAFTNSSTSLPYSQLANDACCTISYVTMFITTSGTSLTFCSVCLVVLSLTRLDGEKITIGGLDENILKKLKGLRFTLPSLSIVEAKQIG